NSCNSSICTLLRSIRLMWSLTSGATLRLGKVDTNWSTVSFSFGYSQTFICPFHFQPGSHLSSSHSSKSHFSADLLSHINSTAIFQHLFNLILSLDEYPAYL